MLAGHSSASFSTSCATSSTGPSSAGFLKAEFYTTRRQNSLKSKRHVSSPSHEGREGQDRHRQEECPGISPYQAACSCLGYAGKDRRSPNCRLTSSAKVPGTLRALGRSALVYKSGELPCQLQAKTGFRPDEIDHEQLMVITIRSGDRQDQQRMASQICPLKLLCTTCCRPELKESTCIHQSQAFHLAGPSNFPGPPALVAHLSVLPRVSGAAHVHLAVTCPGTSCTSSHMHVLAT